MSGAKRKPTTHGHVPAGAGKGAGETHFELAADAKVAELDDAGAGDEDVAGLDVAVGDLVGVHIVETF